MNASNTDQSSQKQQEFLLDNYPSQQSKHSQQPQQSQSPIYEDQTQQPEPQSSNDPQHYQPLEDYIISKTLGKGNFGKVKLATHKLTLQHVAVKILEKDLIFENTDVVRITRELKIMKKLRHPFVVQLYEIIETPKELYLIMEYAEGGDLFDKIVNQQKIKEKQAAAIFTQIALGMDYFHNKGVTHRDLKPQNILLAKDGTIKIADFGLGNMFKSDEKLKTACGSPCYASPQMLNRQPYDPKKIDIWSAGIILYALVCGYLPFEDQVTSKLYQKIKTTNVKLPSCVSSPCRNLIRGLLTKDPKLRFDMDSILVHEMILPQVQKYREMVKERELTENKIEEICEIYDIEEREKLVSDLNKNRHNNLTTLYYLGVRKMERQQIEDQDEDDYLRQENKKVKRGQEKGEVKELEGKSGDVQNLTGIEYEEKKDSKAVEQEGKMMQDEKKQQSIRDQMIEQKKRDEEHTKMDIEAKQTQEEGQEKEVNIDNEQEEIRMSDQANEHREKEQQIMDSGIKSINTEKELSDGQLQIHKLHHEMDTEFQLSPFAGAQGEFKQPEALETELDHHMETEQVFDGEQEQTNDMQVQKVSYQQRQEDILPQRDAEESDEAQIIQQSYQLFMEIQNSLAQLNQLTDSQEQPQEQTQQLPEQTQLPEQQNQSLQKYQQPQIPEIQSHIQRPEQQNLKSNHQESSDPNIESHEPNQLTQLKLTEAQHTQTEELIQTTQIQKYEQQTQTKPNTLVQSFLPISHQEDLQILQIIPQTAPIQHQLPQTYTKTSNHNQRLISQQPVSFAQINQENRNHQLDSDVLISSTSQDKPTQAQLSFSHISQVQMPQIPPSPIKTKPSPTIIYPIDPKPIKPQTKPTIPEKTTKFSKQPSSNLTNKSPPIKKSLLPQQSPQPRQFKPSKLSRQNQNRPLLLSINKTIKPSQTKQPQQIQPYPQLTQNQQAKEKIGDQPINKNIRLNQRSHSKDSPIAFKSNKNPKTLAQMLKNKSSLNQRQKQQPQQQSPRPKQLKSQISSKNSQTKNVNMIVERQKSQSRQKQKQTIKSARQKGPVVKEKFQIAKKVESKIYPKLKNPTRTNKSQEKAEKPQKKTTEFKQIAQPIREQPQRSVQKDHYKVMPKASILKKTTGSNKKAQKNFSDRFKKNTDEDKSQPLKTKEYQQVPISPVSGFYSKGLIEQGKEQNNQRMREQVQSERIQRTTQNQYSFRESRNSSRAYDSQTYQNNIAISYSQKQGPVKSTKNASETIKYEPKTRAKITISQYSSTMNPKSSYQASYEEKKANIDTPKSKGTPKNSSSSFISTKFYQPKAKYSNLYQAKPKGMSSTMNNMISYYKSEKPQNLSSHHNNESETSYVDSPSKSQRSRMSATSNTRQFQRIEIGHQQGTGLNDTGLNITYVEKEPTLVNPELIMFVSVGELYQIVDGLSQSQNGSMQIKGTLSVCEYPNRDYLYVMKSDLYGSSSENKSRGSKSTKITSFQLVQLINQIVLNAES